MTSDSAWDPCRTLEKGHENLCSFYELLVNKAHILAVINCTVGVFGNVLTILIFLRMMRNAKPYIHQIVIIFVDFMECIDCILIILGEHLGVWVNQAPLLVQNSRFLLYLFFLTYPVVNIFTLARQWILCCVTMDRLQGMVQPTVYKYVGLKKRAVLIVVSGLVIGFVTSIHDAFRMTVKPTKETDANKTISGGYQLVFNAEFMRGDFPIVMEFVRIIVRVMLMVALVALSTILIMKYKAFVKERKQLRNTNQQTNDGFVNVNTLARLLLAQSFFTSVGQTIPLLVWYGVLYLTHLIQGHIFLNFLTQFLHITASMTPGYNFLIYFLMSGEFRRNTKALLGLKQIAVSSVTEEDKKDENFRNA